MNDFAEIKLIMNDNEKKTLKVTGDNMISTFWRGKDFFNFARQGIENSAIFNKGEFQTFFKNLTEQDKERLDSKRHAEKLEVEQLGMSKTIEELKRLLEEQLS